MNGDDGRSQDDIRREAEEARVQERIDRAVKRARLEERCRAVAFLAVALGNLGDRAPFDLVTHLRRQRAWSLETFGPGALTVIMRLNKRIGSVLTNPADLMEWVDVALLAFDGAMRAGHEPEAIAAALAEQQRAHETSCQPDWRTEPEGEAIEHEEGGE